VRDAPLPRPDVDPTAPRSLPVATGPGREPVPPSPSDQPLYQRVGGAAFFERLVAAFYGRVAADPVLRPLYPDEDLSAAAERLRLFLEQYWGGPTTYSERRGHPRLRMRHAAFPVGTAQIQAWLVAMRAALDEVSPPPAEDAELRAYFERAAPFLRNTDA
jgi:hemoglobin